MTRRKTPRIRPFLRFGGEPRVLGARLADESVVFIETAFYLQTVHRSSARYRAPLQPKRAQRRSATGAVSFLETMPRVGSVQVLDETPYDRVPQAARPEHLAPGGRPCWYG